ncbi:PREDICTED: centrosomal protein of 72 kDa isoform X3 [Capra hircus]|uniref:centrosomal protein of 72 kDa isoform X3 n=1 Tax=Capra hircus TaxID=9925 RepID=UPI00084741E1|nr:PREDICTED: centrosomal protein of 72 kDa isoform X3 [Capra hircus]
MAPGGRLVLCEEKIREKSGLAPHCDLAELRSLSIPGTYQEKITHLGNSLMNLTGLKSLDLSRNSLVSLEGIECLAALESLNLYYNRISSLAEVFRLHSLAGLSEVDLRLNPVAKSESDFRLFVVRMLPGLQQLDDRPVRESERRASQLLFGSEDSLESKQSFPSVFREERPHHPRVKGTDPSAKKCLVMDADDEAVLSLIAECEWDLSNPPGGVSSSQKESEASLHSSQAESRHRLSSQAAQHQCGDSLWKGPERRRSSSRAGCMEPRLQDQRCGELPPQLFTPAAALAPEPREPDGEGSARFPVTDSTETEDSGASSQKSSVSTQKMLNPLPAPEKHRKRRMPGGRFQAPADEACLSSLEGSLSVSRRSGSEGWGQAASSLSATPGPEQPRPPSASEACPKLHSAVLPGKKATLEALVLEALLDLVDRHWSGRRSLHSSEAFLAQARHILSSVQEFTTTQDTSTTLNEEISSLTLENKSLHSRLAELQQQYGMQMTEVVLELSDTRKEMDYLRQHLDRSLEESSSLKSLLFSMKKDVKTADAPSALNLQISALWSAPTSACCRSWARRARSTRPRWSSCTGATRSSRRPWRGPPAAPGVHARLPAARPVSPSPLCLQSPRRPRKTGSSSLSACQSDLYFFISYLEVKKMLHFPA